MRVALTLDQDQFQFYFLPPATKLGQGYIFTGVCDSVHRGGSTWAGTPPRDQVPPRPGTPPRSRYTPTSSACWEIWATSGRYASYWNAFLLLKKQPILFKLHFTCCFLLFQNPCKNTFMSSCNLQSIYFEVNSNHHKIYRI